jgi:hypothetical protein
MRQLFQQEGWSLTMLKQVFPDYSRSLLERIVSTPHQAEGGKPCKYCETIIQGRRSTREYCNATCRKRAARDHHRPAEIAQKVVPETA